MAKFDLLVWVTQNFAKSWTHLVKGNFADPQLETQGATDLFCYDENSGFGAFFATVKNGRLDDGTLVQDGLHQIGPTHDFPRRWTHVVGGFPNQALLLFYDAGSGVGAFYRTDGHGNLTLLTESGGWRTSWNIIVGGSFGTASLVFYDAANGTGEFYSVDNSGNIHLVRSITGWRNSWNIIIRCRISGNNNDDLLFYDKGAGSAELYKISNQAGTTLFSEHDNWRTTWEKIVYGSFSEGSSGLLFYEEGTGYTEIYEVDKQGNIAQIDVNFNDEWRSLRWQNTLAGLFTPNVGLLTDSFCNYDATDGIVRSFYFEPSQ